VTRTWHAKVKSIEPQSFYTVLGTCCDSCATFTDQIVQTERESVTMPRPVCPSCGSTIGHLPREIREICKLVPNAPQGQVLAVLRQYGYIKRDCCQSRVAHNDDLVERFKTGYEDLVKDYEDSVCPETEKAAQ
jgi:hypothetical protein